nr:uncharacterized protein LOC120968558 [Aegilops tauschii subsp. strangulata]
MSSVVPERGVGDMGGGGGSGTSLDAAGSVDNCFADKKWEIWFHLEGRNPVKRGIYESDISFLTLQSLIASEGYGQSDYMYYVKEEEIGSERVKYLGNVASVHEMLEFFNHVKVVNIRVGRDVEPGISTQANQNYMNTQESCCLKKVVEQSELQNEIDDRKAQLERSRIQRGADLNHFEGDTEVYEFCSDDSVHSDGSAEAVQQMEIECGSEEETTLQTTAIVKHVKNPGPTSRCHNEVEKKRFEDWFPEADEFCFAGDAGICDEEEEDEVELPYLMKKPKTKSSKKKMKERFREALRDFHIRTLRSFHYHRNTPTRIIVCIRAENTKVTTKWLSKAVEPSLRADPRAPVDSLIKNSKVKFSVDVSKSVAYRARRKAIKVVQGDQKEQYYRLRDYLQAVIDTNPGSRCIVTTFEDPENPAPTPRFKYMFYCLHASKQGFLNGCRPFIGLDGCFIKLTTGQQILAATGRDGNNNIYPIAFGVVDKEDSESWTWFLTQLRFCIGSGSKFGTYTIISDRQKGLLKAINEVFPDSPQRYCLRHIYANFQSAGFRGAELKKLVDQASYSFTKHGHELAMAELKAECEDAWKWLTKIPKETWCRSAMDYNCKTDLVVNNLSEVFNKMILDVRAKPIRTMFERIRTKQMIKRQKTREKTENSRWMITPNYSEKLEENKKYAKFCEAHKAGPDIWQVSSKENQYYVNLATNSCDCRRWDMTGVTCSHAIAAMSKIHMHPEDYVHEFFKKPLYIEAYKDIVYPVPGPGFWPDTHTQDIEPPVFKGKAGKKQTARRKGQFEVRAPKDTSRMGTITCNNCGLQGHRYTYCGKALNPSLQMRKNLHQVI